MSEGEGQEGRASWGGDGAGHAGPCGPQGRVWPVTYLQTQAQSSVMGARTKVRTEGQGMVFIWAGKDGQRSPEQETSRDGAWQERGGDGGRGRVCGRAFQGEESRPLAAGV